MFRQVGIGAAAVLTIGLLAAGCSEDGDTIIAGGGALLNNQDSTPFSGLTNNNLAPDGGGFSSNGSPAVLFTVSFNCDSPKSDGTFSGDNSAIVLFTLGNNRVYASYYANGTFTPPSELEAADRDYGTAVALDSYICVPLNTGNYQSANTSPGAEVNRVRANNGNWVIIGSFNTLFNLPGASIDNASSLGRGQRRTLGSWVFLKGEVNNSTSTSAAVGATTREFRYGFQRVGDEIPNVHVSGGLAANTVGATDAPANNVMSYGVATDGLAGQAGWTGQDVAPGAPGQAGPTQTTGTTLENKYSAGEDVSCLAVVFTQIETTLSEVSLRRAVLDNVTQRGDGLFLRYRSFNLDTLTWGTDTRISRGISIHGTTGSTEVGSGVYSDFNTYNNTVFFRYMDASMRVENGGGTPANTVNTLDLQFRRTILAAARFTDQANGTCTLATSGVIDVSTDAICVTKANAAGTPGTHLTEVPTVAPASFTPLSSREVSNFFPYNGESSQQSIYGADEGLGDLTLFFSLADGTTSSGTDTGSAANKDAELAVVVIGSTGALSTTTSFVAGTNPVRISGTHAVDDIGITTLRATAPTTAVNLADGIGTPCFSMNRTGEWIAAAFIRRTGVTENQQFQTDLYANVYQTFRLNSSTTQAGTSGVAANVNLRVLAGGPVIVDSPTSGSLLAPGPAFIGNQIPVNTFCFQGKACYRGWQSNKDVVSLFFEQSDGTGDRVFGARMTVTLGGSSGAPAPPALAAVTAVESVFANNVLGPAAFATTAGAPGTSSFEWLQGNGDVTKNAHFQSVDSGPDSSGNGGSVLVAFTRVDDGTSTDAGNNDFGDVSVYATIFNGTAFETPVKIGTTADTNETLGFVGTAPLATFPGIENLATSNNIRINKLACLPNNTDITNRPSYPTVADSTYVAILLTDRAGASLQIPTGGATTVLSGNASNFLTLGARVLQKTDTTGASPKNSVQTRINGVENTTLNPFTLPLALMHEGGLSTNIGGVECCQSGNTLRVVLEFNGQLWYQATTDGLQWLRQTSTGLANPGLISNFSSADVTNGVNLSCCTDGKGDALSAILQFTKQDINGTSRFFVADSN
ncbi:MAG: hypothetical protein JKY65_03315 [Planctomycetes bacterium]|nr:hypothetical protein [Planctomycetota bacterium]